jgi:hypothetical protein
MEWPGPNGEPSAFAPLVPEAPGLTGQVEGDATGGAGGVGVPADPKQPLQVRCDRLIRMDFLAAGSVLNWTAEQQAHGRVVQFLNLHRLVAVFFNVVGINEHAWVVAAQGLKAWTMVGCGACNCPHRPHLRAL